MKELEAQEDRPPSPDLALKGGDREIQHYGSEGNIRFKGRNRARQGSERER